MENATGVLSSEVIHFRNGEVSKIEISYPGSNLILVYTYTYDGKNNPAKNVTGKSKIAFTNSDNPGMFQNIVSKVEGAQASPQNNVTTTIQYTYNENNYPLTSVTSQQRGTDAPVNMVIPVQYFY